MGFAWGVVGLCVQIRVKEYLADFCKDESIVDSMGLTIELKIELKMARHFLHPRDIRAGYIL